MPSTGLMQFAVHVYIHMNVHTKRNCKYKCSGMILDSGHCECGSHGYTYPSVHKPSSEPCILTKWFLEAERNYVKYIYTYISMVHYTISSTSCNFCIHIYTSQQHIRMYLGMTVITLYHLKVQGKSIIPISGYSVRKLA